MCERAQLQRSSEEVLTAPSWHHPSGDYLHVSVCISIASLDRAELVCLSIQIHCYLSYASFNSQPIVAVIDFLLSFKNNTIAQRRCCVRDVDLAE